MSNPNAKWRPNNVDPTAGVPLYGANLVRCTRCGCVKGEKYSARPGLCTDCRDVLPVADQIPWRVAA